MCRQFIGLETIKQCELWKKSQLKALITRSNRM